MDRYICIHGHFYQPPRENPWLEAVEAQDSAYPFHDWNERITEECYAPNATSRILNDKKQITQIVNNYTKINFDFGPTLLSWLQEKQPEVYRAILKADQESQKCFGGHGNAIAQAYNHMILPLSNRRDKYTQILWGIRDFEHRFQRQTEGMWLPETAVDLESLDIMSELGISYTILAQHQAKQVRIINYGAWHDVSRGRIDPTMPYLLHLPSGRTISVFFYDGPVSQAVAFAELLQRGEKFADSILHIFSDKRHRAQLAHIATDGETYGHHHRFGDMALAYALSHIATNNLANITNYGYFLELFPPTHEVEIFENSSWSCIHGVERWKSACGCSSGGHPNWNQNWRAPLRNALDWLRDTIASLYEEKAKTLFKSPWAARDEYIDVILNRSAESINHFFIHHSLHLLTEEQKQTALNLLEMQRHAMLMYTSCGWFFDELSGIETVQVISYAGRAAQLAERLFATGIENQFLERLSQAKSNLPQYPDGRFIYDIWVKPSMVSWPRIAAHYAISSLFTTYEKQAKIHCYLVNCDNFEQLTSGNSKLIVGRGLFKSIITHEASILSFIAAHFGEQNITCGVREFNNEGDHKKMAEEIIAIFNRADFSGVISLFNKYLGQSVYSINSLFRDEQRWVLNQILENTLKEAELTYRQLYQRHAPLMRFIEELNIPLPEAFQTTAKHVVNAELKEALTKEKLKIKHINKLIDEAERGRISLDGVALGFALQKTIENMMEKFREEPNSLTKLEHLTQVMNITRRLPFYINLRQVQNTFYELLQIVYLKNKKLAEQGDPTAKAWVDFFSTLGNQLSINVA